MKTFNNKLIFSPIPSNIYYLWNFGSLLRFCIIIQLLTGFFLSICYDNNYLIAFSSIDHINRNINLGWLIRRIHANGASAFFIIIYLHVGRGLYYKSYQNIKLVWISGVVLLIFLFITAFLGYVLPWGQIRFWGATVITRLLSSIPYFGKTATLWLWGGFSIRKSRLIRFFSLHFIIPLLILGVIIIHIILLHKKHSNNPLGLSSKFDITPFNPLFTWKDLLGVIILFYPFLVFILLTPYLLIDPDNFLERNPIITPPHIQPEWYFLFAYAILRTIPNKLGGVIALLASILSLIIITLSNNTKYNINNKIIFIKISFILFIINFWYLTSIGRKPIEVPFSIIAEISRIIYFNYFFIIII